MDKQTDNKKLPIITKVIIRRFKRFEDQIFDIKPFNLLIGPNNHGKTSLLQALSAWQLAYLTWKSSRRIQPGKLSKRLRSVPIALPNFYCVPLTDFRHLWTGKKTQWFDQKKYEQYKVEKVSEETINDKTTDKYQGAYDVEIIVEWETQSGYEKQDKCTFGMLFHYDNEQSILVKPTSDTTELPLSINSIVLTHIPPFSGLDTQEEYLTDGSIRRRIGLSQPGSVVRNLLYRVYRDEYNKWKELTINVERYLGVELLDPKFIEDVDPYITCLYKDKHGTIHEPFDLVNGGSGFHQLITLFAIIYWNKGTHLLLDEPDAHLHAWAQAGILDFLQDMTRKGEAQVIIATHSISILDRCKPEDVYSLMTPSPRWLVLEKEKFSIRSGLDSVETSLLTYLEQIPFVLYVEGSIDIELLRLFARALGKDEKLFERLPYHILRGRDPKQAREHFLGVKSFRTDIKALCILDPDTDRENLEESIEHNSELMLEFHIWQRRHIESYLLVPEAIARTLYPNQPLFEEPIIKKFREFLSKAPRALVFPDKIKLYSDFHLEWMETFDTKRHIFSPDPADNSFLYEVSGSTITPQHVAQNLKTEEIHKEISMIIEKIYEFTSF